METNNNSKTNDNGDFKPPWWLGCGAIFAITFWCIVLVALIEYLSQRLPGW